MSGHNSCFRSLRSLKHHAAWLNLRPFCVWLVGKKRHKKRGAEFPRTRHTFGDAMEIDNLTHEKIPKLTPELKEQLKKKFDATSVARSVLSHRPDYLELDPAKLASYRRCRTERRTSFSTRRLWCSGMLCLV
jgi:hypothetical protein